MGNAHGTAAYGQISSASISFISSLTIATAIVRSDGGLTSPFRRLIFGLSLSDVLQSFGLIAGPFASPASDISPFGLGNQGTCSAQGFILHLSAYTVPMYTCALSYYYYCKLKCDMSDETFSRRIEWKAHGTCWLVGLSISITALATETINTYSTGTFCSYATFPADCREHPDLHDECRGENTVFAFEMLMLAMFVLFQFCIIRNVSFMLRQILKRDRAFGETRTSALRAPSTKNFRNSLSGIDLKDPDQLPVPVIPATERLRKNIRRTMMVQSCLYVAAFFGTYFFAWIYIAIFMLGLGPGSFLLISSTMFYPLGGLFNLLVFTRPSVWILRRRHSYSWLKAFVLVIKAGGEVPHEFRDNEPKNEVPRKSPTPLRPSSQDRNMISTGEEEEMIRNLSSVETPPVSFARMISSGLGEESAEVGLSPGNRKIFHNAVTEMKCFNKA
jgi:hypothetical protein